MNQQRNHKGNPLESGGPAWSWIEQEPRLASILEYGIPAIVILAAWEAVVLVFKLPQYVLPAPSAIIREGIINAPRIGPHFLVTFREAITGYILAACISIPLAILVAYSELMRRTAYPAAVLLDIVPKVAFAPLFITWFGFGPEPAILLTTISCIFPILIEGMHGFLAISPETIFLVRSTGAREWEIFWKVRLPDALPYLFVGLKYAGSLAMIGAVVSEFLAGFEGLGYLLMAVMKHVQMALGFAIICGMAVIGFVLFFGMHVVERFAIPWHVSQRSTR